MKKILITSLISILGTTAIAGGTIYALTKMPNKLNISWGKQEQVTDTKDKETIAELNKELSEKDKIIANKDELIEEKNQTIDLLNNYNNSANEIISSLQLEVEELENMLNSGSSRISIPIDIVLHGVKSFAISENEIYVSSHKSTGTKGLIYINKQTGEVKKVFDSGFNYTSCYILSNGNNYYQIEEVDNENITFDRECSFSKGDIITKIGSQDDYLITIQGDSTQNFQHSKNNCLTLSSISVSNDDIPTFEKKIVLGDLTGMPGASGTGLYAENVFLNGTLTTKIQSNENSTYAGINTLTGANSIIFGDEDKTKIVFWAGSSGVSAEDIQKASFQVTESGSIYANKGRFEGSLITDSIIKGASIHTAKIYGEDTKGNQAALQIFDTQRGIQFIDSEASNKVQLGISSIGFYTETDGLFVEMSEGIGYLGQRATYSNNEDSILFIRPNYIGFDNNISSTEPSWKIKYESGFGFVNGESLIFEIKNDLIKSTKKVNFEQNLTFGINNTQGALEYQKTAEGFYNLYVR